MRLAILHCHLDHGGVTAVIRGHLAALAATAAGDPDDSDGRADAGHVVAASASMPASPVLVLTGGRVDAWADAENVDAAALGAAPTLVTVPGLEYDSIREAGDGPVQSPDDLAAAIFTTLADHDAPPTETVLHVHNPTLGKVAALPGAIRRLAAAGYRILAQIHDFAEDGRPDNYAHLRDRLAGFRVPPEPADDTGEAARTAPGPAPTAAELGRYLYPVGPGIGWATLNGRDAAILRTAGFPPRRTTVLPNPVLPPPRRPAAADARQRVGAALGLPGSHRYVLYPVRGIGRKNVGEMGLLATHPAAAEITFAITQRPKNPAEARAFAAWEGEAERLNLSCRFGVGAVPSISFADHLAAADAILTTSVAEGFGMVFLESAQLGVPLIGRDLPGIVADFRAAGLTFPHLYHAVPIPTDLFDPDAVAAELIEYHAATLGRYGRPARGKAMTASLTEALTAGWLDFARLPVTWQRIVLETLATDPSPWERIDAIMSRHGPSVGDLLTGVRTGLTVDPDAAAGVAESFGPAGIGTLLRETYHALMTGTDLPGGDLDRDAGTGDPDSDAGTGDPDSDAGTGDPDSDAGTGDPGDTTAEARPFDPTAVLAALLDPSGYHPVRHWTPSA